MKTITRRECLTTIAGAIGFPFLGHTAAGLCRLSMGTYGLQSLSREAAIKAIAAVGFDGIELAAMPGYPFDPGQLNKRERQNLRSLLKNSQLHVDATMVGIKPSHNGTQSNENLRRLKQCIEFAKAISNGDRAPLLQTILGGQPSESPSKFFLDELQQWTTLATDQQTIIAIKPHRGHSIATVRHGIALLQEMGSSPWLRMAFDYSHFAFRDQTVKSAVTSAFPWTQYVVLKDAEMQAERVRFALPGTINAWSQSEVIQRSYELGYRGSFCCEISSHVWSQSAYDPMKAIQISYQAMANAFQIAGVPRA